MIASRSTGLAAVLVLVVLAAAAAAGEEARAPNELTLVTRRVVVFKDGYALVVKEGTAVSGEDGVVVTHEVPDAAVLGAFWAVPADGRLLRMDAGIVAEKRSETVTKKVAPSGFADLLGMNPGKAATLLLDDGSVVTGSVRAVLGSALVVLRTDAGDVTLPVARIRRLDVAELTIESETSETIEKEEQRKLLTFRFEGGAATRKLTLLYFRPGIRWIPTYRVELPGEGETDPRARIALQAEVLNEAEDLVDAAFDLVVGVPNFRFREVVSPFVLERALRNALAEAAPGLMGQNGLSNAAFRSRAGEWSGDSEGPDVAVPPELTAGGSQDLFVYSFPPMTLEKGHRAAISVFDARVAVGHVYTWDVGVAREDILLAPAGKGDVSPLAISAERIWHQIDLENRTTFPWTTGAAFLVRDGRPLAQELLTYTPVSGRVRVPVTVAVDVRGDYESTEVGRALAALKWERTDYARIDEKGVLRVRNFKGEPVVVEAVVRVGGRAEEASEGAEISIGPWRQEDWRNYRGHPAVNNASTVRFRIPLGPGETAERWFKASYFVRQ